MFAEAVSRASTIIILVGFIVLAVWLSFPTERSNPAQPAPSAHLSPSAQSVATLDAPTQRIGNTVGFPPPIAGQPDSKLTEPKEIEPPDLFSGELVATDHLRDRQRATAVGALETFLWALAGGQQEVVADLTGNWTRQPEAVIRKRAEDRINSVRSFDRVQVVGHEAFGVDHMVLRLQFVRPDSSVVRDVIMMKRVHGKWYCM
ncbi:MAG: hypothetical protein Q7S40_04630 [Opitutaceae bacterium]|nr:hypothetical protein [Opitutaceae bacterium]